VVLLPEFADEETIIEAVPSEAAVKTISASVPENEIEFPSAEYPEALQLARLSMLAVYFTVIVPFSVPDTETLIESPTAAEFLETEMVVVPWAIATILNAKINTKIESFFKQSVSIQIEKDILSFEKLVEQNYHVEKNVEFASYEPITKFDLSNVTIKKSEIDEMFMNFKIISNLKKYFDKIYPELDIEKTQKENVHYSKNYIPI
jgi:hypothetical protein